MTEWVQMALGPLGGLVMAVAATVVLVRELRQRWAEEFTRLEKALSERAEECRALQAKLQDEHEQRLLDAKATTETLLALQARVHQTLDNLETLARRAGGELPTTGRTNPTPP